MDNFANVYRLHNWRRSTDLLQETQELKIEIIVGELMKDISTKRLRLREMRKEDQQTVHEYSSDPEVTRYMNWGPNTEQDTINFIQKSIASQSDQPQTDFTFAVILKSENKLIGSCGIYTSNSDQREGFIGYIFSRSFWGKATQQKQPQH